MTITVNIAGTSVPVPIPDEQFQLIQRDVEATFAGRIVNALTEKAALALDYELTEDEVTQVRNEYPLPETSPDEFIHSLISGDLYSRIKESVREVVDSRYKYFTVRMRATQDIEIVVKATSEEEASEYASRLDYHDLSDYLDDYDHEFEVVEVDPDYADNPPADNDFFNANED